MSKLPNASEELDERIEKRLALLRDSIELKLTKEVDSQLKARFETTGKILGWAFGLVAIVFAAFGIKTLFDVKEVARATAIDEVKKKLAIDDPNSEFRRDIDKIIARGLIDSYLLTLAKSKNERFRSDLNISESDLRRLKALVVDPKTSEKDFSDAIEILLKSNLHGRDETIERLIQVIGTGTDESYRWISNQPEKKASLLRLYTGDKLTQVSSAAMGDEKSPKSLLIAAIKYSGSKDKQSGKLLEGLTRHKDLDIANEAVLALARVEPTSAAVKAVLDKPRKTNDDGDWARAMRLAIEVAKPSRPEIFENDPNLKARQSAAAEAFRAAIARDFVFRLSSNFSRGSSASLYVSSRSNYSILYPVSTDIIRGASQGVITPLFHLASKNHDDFLRTTRAFCLEDDARCWGLVKASLENGGEIILQGGVELRKATAPGGVTIRAESTKPDSPVIVTWTDTNAAPRRGVFSSIKNAEQMNFSIAVTKSLSDDDEE